MSARTGGTGLLLRQSRAHGGALAVVAAVVLVTSTLGCAVPRVLSLVYDEGLRDSIVAAGPVGRELIATTAGDLPVAAGQDPLRDYDSATRALRQAAGPALTPLVAESGYSLTTEPVPLTVELGGEPRSFPATTLRLRAADRWQAHVRVVEGELPSGDLCGACAAPRGEVVDAGACVLDVVVAAAAAPDMELAVGDVVPAGAGGLTGQAVLLRVAGLFEPLDAEADYWTRDSTVLRPAQVFSDLTGLNNAGVALVDDGAWFFADTRVGGSVTAEVRLLTDPAAFSSDTLAQVVAELRRLPTVTISSGEQAPVTLRLRSTLGDVLEGHLAQRATATAVMSVVLAGLLAVALAVLALSARLVTERRRVSVRLAAARGASPRQLALVQAAEGLLVAVPAAALGSLLAAVVVGGRGGRVAVLLPVSVALVTAVVVPVLGRSRRQGPGAPAGGGRRDLLRRLASPGRIVLETSVCVVAVAGVVSLRRRGLTTSAADLGADPLLSAVPVLLAAAAGIVLLRLFPVPLKALGALTARRPGAVAFLGLARSGREVAAGAAPVLVLLLALAMAVFSSVISSTLGRGGVDASWQTVGADVRLAGPLLTDEAVGAAADVDGVAALAPAHVSYDAEVGRRSVALVATDVTAYAAVQRRSPVAPPLPAALDDPVPQGAPVPAVVSAALADVGDELAVRVGGIGVVLAVTATAATLPGVPADQGWLLVPADPLRAAVDRTLPTTTVYGALDPGASADPAHVVEALTDALPTAAAVTTRDAVARQISESGLVAGVRRLFTAGVLTGAAFCALAVVLTLVVTSRQRDLVLSQLRTLGLSGSQARSLVSLEIVPVALAALASGLALGLATPALVAPAIDLRPFTGGDVDTPLTVDVGAVATLASGFVLVVAAAVLLVTAANRRRVLGSVLRVGEDA